RKQQRNRRQIGLQHEERVQRSTDEMRHAIETARLKDQLEIIKHCTREPAELLRVRVPKEIKQERCWRIKIQPHDALRRKIREDLKERRDHHPVRVKHDDALALQGKRAHEMFN